MRNYNLPYSVSRSQILASQRQRLWFSPKRVCDLWWTESPSEKLQFSWSLVWFYHIAVDATITFLDIIHRPVSYLKHDVSETGFCFRLQVGPAQSDPIERAGLCLQPPATTPTGFIKLTQHNPPKRVNISTP
jgi:hypothetical protein